MVEGKSLTGILTGVLIIFIGYFIVLFSCTSVEQTAQEETTKFVLCHVPSGATDIKSIGNGWVEFTYAGHRYLFCFVLSGPSTAASTMTRIDW